MISRDSKNMNYSFLNLIIFDHEVESVQIQNVNEIPNSYNLTEI